MKEDVLNLIATYSTLAEAFTWFMTFAAVLVYGFAGWVAAALGHLAFTSIAASFARANQTIADIQTRKEEQP